MDKHISLARELGYEGQELRDYLKRQQDLEREAQREYKREKREADQKEKDREQKEKDRE